MNFQFFKRKQPKSITPNKLSEDEEEYNNFLNLLKEKSKNAIRITKINNDLVFLGEYVEEYPIIHIFKIYEDINKKTYRFDDK